MKLNFSKRKDEATTAFEVMVVVTCILVLAAILLPRIALHRRPVRMNRCIMNLRQVGLAFRIWEGDNGNQYPMSLSVTNGGAMELVESGDLAGCFRAASNELSTTKILVCPNDAGRTFAPDWTTLNSSHISYFLSADLSNEDNPALVFSGDDNLAIGGSLRRHGLVEFSSNSAVVWSGTRHGVDGNIGFADGSVRMGSSGDLQDAFQRTGLETNRIVVP